MGKPKQIPHSSECKCIQMHCVKGIYTTIFQIFETFSSLPYLCLIAHQSITWQRSCFYNFFPGGLAASVALDQNRTQLDLYRQVTLSYTHTLTEAFSTSMQHLSCFVGCRYFGAVYIAFLYLYYLDWIHINLSKGSECKFIAFLPFKWHLSCLCTKNYISFQHSGSIFH